MKRIVILSCALAGLGVLASVLYAHLQVGLSGAELVDTVAPWFAGLVVPAFLVVLLAVLCLFLPPRPDGSPPKPFMSAIERRPGPARSGFLGALTSKGPRK